MTGVFGAASARPRRLPRCQASGSKELSLRLFPNCVARRELQLDPFKLDLDYSPVPGNTGTVVWAEVQWSEEVQLRPVALFQGNIIV
jgi:hypothetical protein